MSSLTGDDSNKFSPTPPPLQVPATFTLFGLQHSSLVQSFPPSIRSVDKSAMSAAQLEHKIAEWEEWYETFFRDIPRGRLFRIIARAWVDRLHVPQEAGWRPTTIDEALAQLNLVCEAFGVRVMITRSSAKQLSKHLDSHGLISLKDHIYETEDGALGCKSCASKPRPYKTTSKDKMRYHVASCGYKILLLCSHCGHAFNNVIAFRKHSPCDSLKGDKSAVPPTVGSSTAPNSAQVSSISALDTRSGQAGFDRFIWSRGNLCDKDSLSKLRDLRSDINKFLAGHNNLLTSTLTRMAHSWMFHCLHPHGLRLERHAGVRDSREIIERALGQLREVSPTNRDGRARSAHTSRSSEYCSCMRTLSFPVTRRGRRGAFLANVKRARNAQPMSSSITGLFITWNTCSTPVTD